jgi:hypothetical protein
MVCFSKHMKPEPLDTGAKAVDDLPCLSCKVWRNTMRYCRVLRFFKRCDAVWGCCGNVTCSVGKLHLVRCFGCKKLSEVVS